MFTQLYPTVLSSGVTLISATLYLKFKKRILRVITNAGRRDSCRELYKNLKILTLPSQYIFSLLVFVNKNRSCFVPNSEVHDINTHQKHNLHFPSTKMTSVQKRVLFSGSKIYNHLPLYTKMQFKDAKCFKSTLRTYHIEHAFYSLNEYYQITPQ
jgi:hypothetical protein